MDITPIKHIIPDPLIIPKILKQNGSCTIEYLIIQLITWKMVSILELNVFISTVPSISSTLFSTFSDFLTILLIDWDLFVSHFLESLFDIEKLDFVLTLYKGDSNFSISSRFLGIPFIIENLLFFKTLITYLKIYALIIKFFF